MKTFTKILIANRGEIACRIMRTAHKLGYRCVAVYSDADAGSLHVSLADEAIRIGPAPVTESYLNGTAIIAAAQRCGAQAIHPGYGFLSENAGFAQACLDASLVFIGPPPAAIAAMGDKAAAKRCMMAAGVPTVPGYLGEEQSDAAFAAAANKVGFPLLVKAVSGGGGRGMRRVVSTDFLAEALEGASREALAAFGDGTLMLERLIEQGRHIEIQVFADAHGNAVHLGERDCTAQRRRQKVIEEAPSPVVSPDMRATMGRDAVAAALAVGYRGAGTIEFIVDAAMNHYFLEMNTRLQVEHPVTEMITGLDLVEWQLRIASGEQLPLRQEEIRFSGHAIEARLYAEDPYAGFAPQTGEALYFRPPPVTQAGVRIDAGIVEGDSISPYYDPMVAKVIAHGQDRDEAIRRLMVALEDSPLLGVNNNGRFLRDLVDHQDFRAARMHTTLLDEWTSSGESPLQRPQPNENDWGLAAALFSGPAGWRSRSVNAHSLTLSCLGQRRTLRVEADATGVKVGAGDTAMRVTTGPEMEGVLHYTIDGLTRRATIHRQMHALHIARQASVFVFTEDSPFPASADSNDPRLARANVAGTVARISVALGESVSAEQTLAVIEAMKMEMRISAGANGTVTRIHATLGEQVAAGSVLIELKAEEA